jgi:hypothetical protein
MICSMEWRHHSGISFSYHQHSCCYHVMGSKENGCGIQNGGWRLENHIRNIQCFIYRILKIFTPYAVTSTLKFKGVLR